MAWILLRARPHCFGNSAIVWHWDSIVASQGRLLAHLRAGGVVGPLWCVLARALQVVIFIIPGEATQIAAGYVFGAGKGFLYAALGTFLGSVFNFHVGDGRGARSCGKRQSGSGFE
jgi:uncharacterized membrane protein YdjX (TVP38/TMEM64 family)